LSLPDVGIRTFGAGTEKLENLDGGTKATRIL